MRILFFAKDAPFVNSGYGKCCREICTRLRRLGHDVAVFATVGNRSAFIFEWAGLPIYPGVDDVFGEDILLDHYKDWKAEVLITQLDVWPMRRIPEYAKQGLINWLPYAPFDSLPPCRIISDKLRNAVHVVAMCKWAKQQMENLDIEATAIHHGVDTNIYRILGDKNKFKLELGFPKDCFLVGMVQANQFLRKALEEQFRAIKIFKENHPQVDIRLYCHSLSGSGDSFHLPSLAQELGIQDVVKFPNDYQMLKGIPEGQMSRIYNAFDVLMSVTNGEGFGLPVIEAQGCGVPVVVTNCMSFPELVLSGEVCDIKSYMMMPAMLIKVVPDERDIANKLWKVYNTNYNSRELSYMAHYLWNWDSKIIQEWMWVLDFVKEKIGRLCLTEPVPSTEAKKLAKEICVY